MQNESTYQTQTEQLELALCHAPDPIREHGYSAAHSRPLVGIRREGGRFDSWRTDPPRAWPYPYIELDAAHVFSVLLLDCDDPEALLAAEDRGALPVPNWQTLNLENGHRQLGFALRDPVARHPKARPDPLRLLARCSEYLTAAAGADPSYTGVLSANPCAPPPGRIVQWGRIQPYPLGELREWVPRGFRAPRPAKSALGRNCALFEAGMKWAGRPVNAGCSVLAMLNATNEATYDPALGFAEVAGIARSVERYRARWIASGWAHRPAWLAKQARLAPRGGKASGRVRRARAELLAERALELRAEGLTVREIAGELEIGESTAWRYLASIPSHEPYTVTSRLMLFTECMSMHRKVVVSGVEKRREKK